MKEKTKAYVAGILDAEGCLEVLDCPVRNTTQFLARVKISNKDRHLMKYLVLHFGGDFKKEPNNEGWIFNWRVTNLSHIHRFLSSVLPYLQIKKDQADVVLEYCSLDRQKVPDERKALCLKMEEIKNRSVETKTQGFSGKQNLVNAYYAGLFDGEGDLGISLNYPRQRTEPAYYGYARCKNTFKSIIDLMPSYYKGNLSTIHESHSVWSPQRVWRLNQKNDLESFLLKVLPYLVVKRELAKTLLNFVRLTDGPQSETRLCLYTQMKNLNNPKT